MENVLHKFLENPHVVRAMRARPDATPAESCALLVEAMQRPLEALTLEDEEAAREIKAAMAASPELANALNFYDSVFGGREAANAALQWLDWSEITRHLPGPEVWRETLSRLPDMSWPTLGPVISTAVANHLTRAEAMGAVFVRFGVESNGVPAHVLNALPMTDGVTDMCSICLTESSLKKVELPCKHTFDYECISAWFERMNTCPLCRQKVEYVDC